MTFELTPQTIITAGAVITAAVLLIQRFAKGVRWFDQQEKQTTDIAALKAKHEADIKALKQALARICAASTRSRHFLHTASWPV